MTDLVRSGPSQLGLSRSTLPLFVTTGPKSPEEAKGKLASLAEKHEVAEPCFDFLFAAMIDALHAGGDYGERSDELLAETVRSLGFDVGYR